MSVSCIVEIEGGGHRAETYGFTACPRVGEMVGLPVRNRPGYNARFLVQAVVHLPDSQETGQAGSTLLFVKATAQQASGGASQRHSA